VKRLEFRKPDQGKPMARFLVHRHTTGRTHFDLRLIRDGSVRSWSLLKEPPERKGERRLAIEREAMSLEQIEKPRINEDAFGPGRARIWDGGEAEIMVAEAERLVFVLAGTKLAGRYELKHMNWYPGNRWLLQKSGV
jgi:DNA ligase D-like protein (predicted 3'-phosphoesterase)